jgi:hypothetical protein
MGMNREALAMKLPPEGPFFEFLEARDGTRWPAYNASGERFNRILKSFRDFIRRTSDLRVYNDGETGRT